MKKKILILLSILIAFTIIISLNNNSNKKENIEIINIKEAKNKKKKKQKNNELDFNAFSYYIKQKEVYTFAITSNNSNISTKFKELINTLSINKNEKIYILKLDTLSKKDKAKYYNINKELAKLEQDFLIKTYDNQIIEITTFDKDNIDILINNYKKE